MNTLYWQRTAQEQYIEEKNSIVEGLRFTDAFLPSFEF